MQKGLHRNRGLTGIRFLQVVSSLKNRKTLLLFPKSIRTQFFEIVKKETDFAVFIDITSKLSPESFSKTDTHWRQEKIGVVADTIADYLGFIRKPDYAEKVTKLPFYGVYYGMSALPLPSEKLIKPKQWAG